MILQSHSLAYIQKRNSKKYTHPNVNSSNIYNSQDMGAPYVSTDR